MNTLKLAAVALVAALVGAIAFAGQSAGPPRESMQDSVNLQAIDNFLAGSKKYLGL
jgi:hypothetical protein